MRGPQPQVLVDPAGQVAQTTAEDAELLIGDALQEVPVVADDDQRAGPGVQQVLHGRQHVGVQVVGRLVEDQHVGLFQQDQEQLQPALLPTGQVLHGGGQLGTGEAETFQQLAGAEFLCLGTGSERVGGGEPAEHDPYGLVEMLGELLHTLGERGDLHRLAVLDPAFGRLDRPVDQPQQRRLPDK